jgi:hypothetical protein
MCEEVIAGSALAEPQTGARDVIATCRSAWGTAHASQTDGGEVDGPALTIYIASCDKLEELGYSVEERSAELEIMLMEDGSPYDGDVMVSPAAFLNPGPVPLNDLTVVMDVRPVREQHVCCALVPHKAKEGSHWWNICGGTGAHSHQGLTFCERHQMYLRTQATSGKVPIFTTDTVACSASGGICRAAAAVQLPPCRCRSADAAVQMPQCRCRRADAAVQIPFCRCRRADAALQLPPCRCRRAAAAVQLLPCSCRRSAAAVQLPLCSCRGRI